MSEAYKTFLCPFPFVVPASYAGVSNLTTAQCTATIADVFNPTILVYQIIFLLLWVVVVILHSHNINKLRKIVYLTPIDYYKFNMAKKGVAQGLLAILYWIVHEARGYWYYNNNNLLSDIITVFLFWLTLDLVEFWGAMAKIRVKLRVTRHGISRKEKYSILFVFSAGGLTFGSLSYYGPQQICTLFSGIKFLVYALGLVLLIIRASLFVRSIDAGITEMKESSGDATRRRLIYQLRIKFGAFFGICIGCIGYLLATSIIRLISPSYVCHMIMSNWNYKYSIPPHHFLFVFVAYVVLFQFADIMKLPWSKSEKINITNSKSSDPNAHDSPSKHYSTMQRIKSAAIMNSKESGSAIVTDNNEQVPQPTS